MRVYAVGDVHGHLDKLRAAHDLIAADGGASAQVVHVGDLTDHGPDAAGVVAFLMDGQRAGRDWIVVKGNHDRQLPQFLRDPLWIDPCAKDRRPWTMRASGSDATLRSYGVDPDQPLDRVHADALRAVPPPRARWLDALPAWHLTPFALFVHAGVRPGIDLCAQAEDDLLWIRRDFHDDQRDHGVLVVHGHTPVPRVTHYGNRLNIDTGATNGGPVSAVVIDAGGVHLLTADGRVPVPKPGAQGC